jgi:hypothetical protein
MLIVTCYQSKGCAICVFRYIINYNQLILYYVFYIKISQTLYATKVWFVAILYTLLIQVHRNLLS